MNEKAAFEKYVAKPFPGSSHSWAESELASLETTSKVLDIGSGQGALGAFLQKKGFAHVDAVEIDAATRAHTQGLYKTIVPSLDELDNTHYDVILLLDIIEHLASPGAFLEQVRSACAPQATLLISVPNIAHWSIRLMLLCGYFEYMERGPLDKTHLHFFTKRHLKQTIENIDGFEIRSLQGSIVPLELMLPEALTNNAVFRYLSRTRKGLANALPSIGAYQHLAKVRYMG